VRLRVNLIAVRPHILETRETLSNDKQHDVELNDARVGWSAVAGL